jgi:hypothetical protein
MHGLPKRVLANAVSQLWVLQDVIKTLDDFKHFWKPTMDDNNGNIIYKPQDKTLVRNN